MKMKIPRRNVEERFRRFKIEKNYKRQNKLYKIMRILIIFQIIIKIKIKYFG